MWGWFRSFQRSASNLRSGALLKTAGEEWAPPPLLASPCSRAVCSVNGAQSQSSAKGPGSLSWGWVVALPSSRLQLRGWNQLNQRGFGASQYFFQGPGVNHCLESLQDELTIARFSDRGVGSLLASDGWTSLSFEVLSAILLGTSENEGTVPSTHLEASPPLLQRAFHAVCCQLCYGWSPSGLIPTGDQPCWFQLNFLKSMVCHSLSLPFWGDF